MIVAVSTTKSVTFRGAAQEFGNTYYYNLAVGVVSEATGLALIDAIVALEKPIHAVTVTFVRGKVWSAGGTPAQNQMIAQKNLSGTGQIAGPEVGLDKERAYLVRFRAGVDSRGRPAYLRKWWHLDATTWGGSTLTDGQLNNTAQLTSGQRAALVTEANKFKSVTANTFTFELVGPSGRQIDGDTVAHPYLEHHQLGEMWR